MAVRESENSIFTPPCFRNIDLDCAPDCPSHADNLVAFNANALKRGVTPDELKQTVRSAPSIKKAVVSIQNSTALPQHLCSNDS